MVLLLTDRCLQELALQGLAAKQKDVHTRIEQIQKVLEALQKAHEQQKQEAGSVKLENESTTMVGVSA
jgi:flagellin-specific chaperone FliS